MPFHRATTVKMQRIPARAEDHIEELIDEALEETFPSSDPPRPAVWVATQSGITVPKVVDH